jgi:flagellar FliL protein
MSKLLPLLLIVVGIAAGGAGGFFLRPTPTAETATPPDGEAHSADTPASSSGAYEDGHGDKDAEVAIFVKLNNQFVIPVVKGGQVSALVVMSLSLEVRAGGREQVYSLEPKIRDALLTVLFEHANAGGFDGNFTASRNMDTLRRALTQASRQAMETDIVESVLVMDIVRQDVS